MNKTGMTKMSAAVLLALSTLPLSACVDDYGYGGVASYGPGPYAYDGWYDGYYGPIYDGYWGSDNYFYYRHGAGERGFTRGDRGHFARQAPQGQHNFQQLHGNMTPGQGMRMPHFPRGGGGGNHRR